MSNEISNIQEEVAKKREVWATFGESIHKKELQLQALAQQSIQKLWTPTGIDQVKDAEDLLKELKSDKKKLEEERKPFTTRLNDVASRFMSPEKSLDEPIAKLSEAIILVKKKYEKDQEQVREKQAEIVRVRESLSIAKSNLEASFKKTIQEKISKAYSYALGDGNIHPAELKFYLEKCYAKVNEATISYEVPKHNCKYLLDAEISEIVSDVFIINRTALIEEYRNGLNEKFSDYEVAYNNKIESLAKSQREQAEKLRQIELENQNSKAAAQLDAFATPVSAEVSIGVKALKKSYELDMPENVQSVISIMAAFAANLNLCLPKLKVNKWFAFTPAQAAIALSKVKCDDNNFQPTGIIFKEVDKL